MRDYFLRRLLLLIPTLLGITLIVFFITRIVPGGPLERAIMESQLMTNLGGTGSDSRGSQALSEEQLDQLRQYYGLDKPWYSAYFLWLGNVLRGDWGDSHRYGEPVLQVIVERLPISTYFGALTFLFTYLICIPLGILKALHHRKFFDNASSIVVLLGYAVPGYALGAMLLVFFAARLEWFPLSGFVSSNFSDLTLPAKILDLLHHTTLPLICYLIGNFAILTLLVKNNLMDQLAADYVRTAMAKGATPRRAIYRHALRNAFIPIATNLGQIVTIFLGGFFLIETIFDIDGLGLLGFKSVVDRDYPVVMGTLLLSSFLVLLGNILSDVFVALVDPRVRFR